MVSGCCVDPQFFGRMAAGRSRRKVSESRLSANADSCPLADEFDARTVRTSRLLASTPASESSCASALRYVLGLSRGDIETRALD